MNYDTPHFLDTNIFMSISFKDKFKESCTDYFKRKYVKYTSEKVENESYNLITKSEYISFEILKEIENYIYLNNIADEEIVSHLKYIQKNFVKKYSNKKYPFGFKKDKFEKITKELFLNYYDTFKRDILYLPIIQILNKENKKTKNTFKQSTASLIYLFDNVHVLNFSEEKNDENILKNLKKNGIHPPDNYILLDSYKTSKLLNESIIFITMDKGILKRKNILLKEFKSEIDVKHPEEYINN